MEHLGDSLPRREIFKSMKIISELRLRARHILWPILWTILILYITYHALQGERGLIAFWQLHWQVSNAKQIQQALKATKQRLQNRVDLLSPKSLDSDMLEERVRIMLGYSRPNETIIITKQ